MKNIILLVPIMFFLAGCAASSINITAHIPDTQEVDISIKTTNVDKP